MLARLIDLVYGCLYWILGVLFVLTHSFRVEGRGRIPRRGPVLIIANHQSYLDIILSGLASRRRVYWVAKKPLYSNRILAWLMHAFDTVAIDNAGIGRAGLEGVLDHLKRGRVVLVFPEGERCWDGKVNELKPGISLVVRKARAPVVPMGIAGAFEAWPRFKISPVLAPPFLAWGRQRIAVAVGQPLDGKRLAEMGRDEMMATLNVELQKVVRRSAQLRGV